MLLTISTRHAPATDLGYLLHKNPDRVHRAELSFGDVFVVFPEAAEDVCTAALLVEVDSVGLVRNRHQSRHAPSLFDYVSDRPYTANSYVSAAIGKMFGTAMGGRSKERPELAEQAIPLEIAIPVLACRGAGNILEQLFGPLGWQVRAEPIAMDPAHPQWGDSPYRSVVLTGELRLKDALEHLYVLLPVLDGSKHYWVNADEIDRLLRRGGAWVANHPERDLIARRYMRRDRKLTSDALARLAELDESASVASEEPDLADDPETAADAAEEVVRSASASTSGARPRSLPRCKPPHPVRWSTSVVARDGSWADCSRRPRSSGCSASTCRTARWPPQPGGSSSTGWRPANAIASTFTKAGSPTSTRP